MLGAKTPFCFQSGELKSADVYTGRESTNVTLYVGHDLCLDSTSDFYRFAPLLILLDGQHTRARHICAVRCRLRGAQISLRSTAVVRKAAWAAALLNDALQNGLDSGSNKRSMHVAS